MKSFVELLIKVSSIFNVALRRFTSFVFSERKPSVTLTYNLDPRITIKVTSLDEKEKDQKARAENLKDRY